MKPMEGEHQPQSEHKFVDKCKCQPLENIYMYLYRESIKLN